MSSGSLEGPEKQQDRIMKLEEELSIARSGNNSSLFAKGFKNLTDIAQSLVGIAVVGSALTYGAMTLAYGPYDAGKVIYSELSGKTNLKHKHFVQAKTIYAQDLLKQELDERDVKNLFIKLGVVGSEDEKPTEADISWYTMLDWIEDHD